MKRVEIELEFEKKERKNQKREREREDRPSVLSRIEINYRRAIAGRDSNEHIRSTFDNDRSMMKSVTLRVEKFLP